MSEKFNAAFWKWFGDSKVVDKNGEPLVVYHGTDSEFSEFAYVSDPENGFCFSDKKTVACGYGGRVVAAHLSIKNPYVSSYRKWMMDESVPSKKQAIKDGYDGFIIRDFDPESGYTGDVYMAFKSSQIKSIDNDGTWDADDPDIRSNPVQVYSDDEDLKDWGSDEWDARQEKRIAESKRRILRAAADYSIVEFSRKDGHKLYLHQTSNSGPNAWQVSFIAPDGIATMDTIFKTRERALASIAGADISPNIGQPGEWKVTAKRNVRGKKS